MAGTVVLVSVLVSWRVHAREWSRRVDPAAYSAAASWIRASHRAGDHLVVHPFWATRIREQLGDLGEGVWGYRHLRDEPFDHSSRVWLLALAGRDTDDDVREGLGRRGVLEETRRFGALTVLRYRMPEPVHVLWDARAHVPEAAVSTENPAGAAPCAWRDGVRWQCAADPDDSVHAAILELDDTPRAVVWAPSPAEAGARRVLAFPSVPVGSRLSVAVAMLPVAAREGGPPAAFSVRIAGLEVFRRLVLPGARFRAVDVETRAWEGTSQPVRVEVEAVAPRLRPLVFALETQR